MAELMYDLDFHCEYFDPLDYWTTREILLEAKEACGVKALNSEMTDEEIRKVMRWVGMMWKEPSCFGPKSTDILLNRSAVAIMLFVTICEFPEFYCRYGLSQYN